MRKIVTFLSVALFLAQPLMAQFSTDVEVSTYSDDNVFRTPQPISDVLNNVNLTLAYQTQNSGTRFYYNGGFFLYNDLNERNFTLQTVGLNIASTFGEDDRHSLYWGADMTMRLNGQDYNYYNYTQLYAYANLNLDLNFMFLKGGYNFRYRGYSNLPDLTNYRHWAFIQLNKSFATRTTLILEADLGHKSFAGVELYSPNPRSEHGHRGRWVPSITSQTSTIPSMTQGVFLARIAQSIFTKMGIFVQYRKQISLSAQSGYRNTEGYFQDEELFDDPFSYQGDALSSQLTWMLPWAMKVKLGGEMIQKTYISEKAYISAEDTAGRGDIREDQGRSIFVSLNKTFYLRKNWLDALEINLNYNYIHNTSNSYWYNYTNSMAGLGVTWKF